jgi:putative ABC transport system permease protein
MHLRDIAFVSLKRRRARGAFVVVALTLGVGTLVGIVSLTRAMRSEVADELDRFGANIVITPKTTVLDLAYGSVDLGGVTVDSRELRIEDVAQVRTIHHRRNISAVAPKLIGTVDAEGTRVVIVGIDYRQEPGVRGWWQVNGRWPTRAGEALVGAEVAAARALAPGAVLRLGGLDLRVTGVLQPTGALDDHAAFTDLPSVQAMLNRPGALTLIEVSALCRGCPIEDIVSQVASVLPHARVAPVRQAVAAREQAVAQMTRFAWLVSAVVLLAAIGVVLTTMLASVSERRQEIGILRAVGFRQAHVLRVMLIEAVVTSGVGGALGWIAGSLGALAYARLTGELATAVRADGTLAVAAVGTAVLLGAVGGLYPAVRAARLDPVIAFRQV